MKKVKNSREEKLKLPPNEDIYKVRIPNPDARKGTRGGFRGHILYVNQAELLEIINELRE